MRGAWHFVQDMQDYFEWEGDVISTGEEQMCGLILLWIEADQDERLKSSDLRVFLKVVLS
jgi:hypothetical protein